MSPGVLAYALRALGEATEGYLRGSDIEKAGDTIMSCAVIAAVAGVGSGWLPGAGALVATAAWVAAIWGMYVKINKDLGITIKDNVLKSLASALLTNLIASAGALILMLVGSTLLSFIPGLGTVGAIAIDGAIGYVTVFASGVLYIKLLTKLFKAGKGFNISENNVENLAKDIISESDVKKIIKEGKNAFKEDQKAGKFKKK
ncbi:MAG: hypothetical protein IJE15_09715 [Bacteroidaceae bacterium]|nr:hypothetical protein [Bacteroidaceae bacterium]